MPEDQNNWEFDENKRLAFSTLLAFYAHKSKAYLQKATQLVKNDVEEMQALQPREFHLDHVYSASADGEEAQRVIVEKLKHLVDDYKEEMPPWLKPAYNVLFEDTRLKEFEYFVPMNEGIRPEAHDVFKLVENARTVWIYNTFIPDHTTLADVLRRGTSDKDVQIVVASPFAVDLIARRSKQLSEIGFNSEKYFSAIMSTIRTFHELDQVSLHVSKAPPTISIYRIDDYVYAGPFMHGILAHHASQFRFPVESNAGEMLLAHFKSIRDDAPEVDDTIVTIGSFEDVCHEVNNDDKLNEVKPEQAAATLFSRAVFRDTPYKKVSKEIHGIYRFARYRVRKDISDQHNEKEKFIVTGVCEIKPYDPLVGMIEYREKIPFGSFEADGTANRSSGFVLPYADEFYLIGDEQNGGHPVLTVLSRRRDRTLRVHGGLILRRHVRGPLISGHIVFIRTDSKSFDEEFELMKENGAFLSDAEFDEQFERFGARSSMLINRPEFSGKGLLEIIGHKPA